MEYARSTAISPLILTYETTNSHIDSTLVGLAGNYQLNSNYQTRANVTVRSIHAHAPCIFRDGDVIGITVKVATFSFTVEIMVTDIIYTTTGDVVQYLNEKLQQGYHGRDFRMKRDNDLLADTFELDRVNVGSDYIDKTILVNWFFTDNCWFVQLHAVISLKYRVTPATLYKEFLNEFLNLPNYVLYTEDPPIQLTLFCRSEQSNSQSYVLAQRSGFNTANVDARGQYYEIQKSTTILDARSDFVDPDINPLQFFYVNLPNPPTLPKYLKLVTSLPSNSWRNGIKSQILAYAPFKRDLPDIRELIQRDSNQYPCQVDFNDIRQFTMDLVDEDNNELKFIYPVMIELGIDFVQLKMALTL